MRHFKFWLVEKMFPDGELKFLHDPWITDLRLSQIFAEHTYDQESYKFIGSQHAKEVLVTDMLQNLVNHLDYETIWEDDTVKCTGKLTIAQREVID